MNLLGLHQCEHEGAANWSCAAVPARVMVNLTDREFRVVCVPHARELQHHQPGVWVACKPHTPYFK